MAIISFDEYVAQQKKKKKNVITLEEYMESQGLSSVGTKDEDVAPVNSSSKKDKKTTKTEDGQKNSYLQKGALEDGFSLKNLWKGARATEKDMLEDAYKSILGGVEKVTDFFYNMGAGLTQVNMTKVANQQIVYDAIVKGEDNAEAHNEKLNKEKAVVKQDAKEFVAKDLIKEEEIAQKHIIAPYEERTGINVEESSYLGAKGDSLVQSATDMLVRQGVSLINPVLGVGLTVASVGGGEMENAYRNDATYEEATLSGIISGLAEAGVEQISGIKFGGKTLTDGVVKGIAKNISNKFLATLAKWGFDTASEGVEEVLSYYLSSIGQNITYMSEKEFNEIFTSEEAWENFIAGAIMGGMFGGASAINSAINPNANDYVTGKSKDEQKVFDEVYKEVLAERNDKYGKVTSQTKSELYDEVEKYIEKGYVDTDYIESLIGGKAYDAYAEIEKRANELLEARNKILNSKNYQEKQVLTQAQQKELDKITKEWNEIIPQLKDAKLKLMREVSSKVKNTNLIESYRELERSAHDFEIDLESVTNENARKTVENFIEIAKRKGYGNTNKAHDFLELCMRASEDRGHIFRFVDADEMADIVSSDSRHEDAKGKFVEGFLDENTNEIYINMDANKWLNSLVGHEIMHGLEKTQAYENLTKALVNHSMKKGEYNRRLASVKKRYAEKDVNFELSADLLGDYIFNDSDFVKSLAKENPTGFKKALEELKYFAKIATAGSQQKRELEKAKREFVQAWRESQNTSKQTEATEDADASKDSTIRHFVSEEVDNVSDRLSASEWNRVQSAVAEYKKLNYHYEKSSNGDIIIPINNKLVYTDANYDSLGISKIIEIDSNIETEIDEARSWIYYAEEGKYSLTDTYEVIESITGYEIINEYKQKSSESVKGYDRRTSRGKSRSDSYHSNYLQERIRRANEIIHSVNGETSSKDGVFFDAENKSDARYSIADNYGNSGYIGQSMSVRAKEAYENGEMPKSKWTKTALAEAISEVNPDIDVSKLNAETLKEKFLTKTSWHHTSKFYNETDFYSVDEDFVKELTQEDVDTLSANQTTKPRATRDAELDAKVEETYAKALAIVEAGIVKTENGAINRLLNGNEDTYQKAVDIIRKRDASKIESWRKLPEGHHRQQMVELYDTNIDEYIKQMYASDKLSKNSNTFKAISKHYESASSARHSIADSDGKELTKGQQDYFKNSKVRDENGNLKVMYHGTGRADRVGTVFDPNRATSGPMAYFTDSKVIAGNYARDKKDTSLAYDSDYDSYETQFRVTRNGKNMSVVDLWSTLSFKERNAILEKAKHITLDEDYENVIYDENSEYGLGNFDRYELNAHRGNALHTLVDSWLTDGNIFGKEHKFLDVLKMVGIEDAEYKNPDYREEKVYEVYLNITNPFDTANVDESFLRDLTEYLENADLSNYDMEGNMADMWDKRNIAPNFFLTRLADDVENGTTHSWTAIPDYVTDFLKEQGYDGIVDSGGKNGGDSHQVAIPFYSEQIKNVNNENPTKDADIRYSIADIDGNTDDIAPTIGWDASHIVQEEEMVAPIDSKARQEYNNSNKVDINLFNGGVEDGSTNETGQGRVRTAGILERRSTDRKTFGRQMEERREKYRADTRVSKEFLATSKTDREKLHNKGVTDNEFWDSSSNPELFSFALESGRASNPHGVMVDPHTASGLLKERAKTFLSKDKLSGGAVMPDGNITAVFKNSSSTSKRAGVDIIITALVNGGTKLDCYSGFLSEMYMGLGFEPVAKVKFNPKHAPEGWDIEKFGTPDIYFMKHNGKSVSEVIDDYVNDTAHIYSAEEIDALPYMEYEEAWAYRDSLIKPKTTDEIVGQSKFRIADNGEFDSKYYTHGKDLLKRSVDDIAPINESFNSVTQSEVISDEVEEAPVEAPIEAQTEEAPINESFPTEQLAPIRDDAGNLKQRKWVETSTESDAVGGSVAIDDLDQDIINYQPIPNSRTIGNANAKLDSIGYDEALKYFNSQFHNKSISLDDVALGERLLQEAVKKGDTETAHSLIQNISILGTELGQKVQALSIIKKATPEGQLRMLEKMVERGKTKGDKVFDGVEVTKEMRDHILSVYGRDGSYKQEDLDRTIEEVKQQIADQMGVTKLEKVNAWRMLSMLGNPKTHIRNLVSNVAMRGTLSVKNAIARTIESVAPIKNRTKTWEKPTDVVKSFAEQTTMEMKGEITGGGKHSDDANLKQMREIFKNKILNGVYEFNSEMLEKEDWWFSKPAFREAFAEYLTANGVKTEGDIKKKRRIVAKAKAYALEQSQIATFRQFSYLANKIGEMERKNTAFNIGVGSVLPFKKTPINIAKTGLNYSPLGFAKTLAYDIPQMKKGNMEASEVVDHLAQNITGTALSLVGFMLASMGVASGGGEDDKEGKYDYQLGEQKYALNIGGKSYSLSWLSPVAMPMFVGVNAYEQLVEGKEWNGDLVMETLAKTLDPLSEMSFLSSLDDVLSSYDKGTEKIGATIISAGQSYVSQFIPTLSSQVATVLDDKKRSTKVGADSGFKMVEETINELKYKIPFLRETLEPSTDIWGNEVKQTENVLGRTLETFIAPYSKKNNIGTGIDDEIKSVYRETGEGEVIPSIPDNYTNFKDEKYKMSAKEYTEYKKTYGQLANELLGDLFDTKTYKKATSEEKAQMIGYVYDYARDEAKKELLDKRGVEYTNATQDGVDYYQENAIKGAIEHDMPVDEYKFYRKNPKKHAFFTDELGITYKKYDNADEKTKDAYNWAFDNQRKYTVSKAIADDVVEYRSYAKALNDIKAGDNTKSLRIDYINSLPIDEGQAIILYRTYYDSEKDKRKYNGKILDYINSREDLTYEERVTILEELDFTVHPDGRVEW